MGSFRSVFLVGLIVFLTIIFYIEAKGTKGKGTLTQDHAVYTPSWAVEITEGGRQIADSIAQQNGFVNLGEIKVDDSI